MEDSSAFTAVLEASSTGTSKRRKLSFCCVEEEEEEKEEEEEDSTALTSLASPPADLELRSRAALFSSDLAAADFVPAAEFCSGDSRSSSSCSCQIALTRFSSSNLVETLEELHVAGDPEMKSLETEIWTCINANFSRENSPSSNLLSAKTTAESSLRKPTATKLPPQAEIEEFFSAAEKYEQKRFMEKYNYDIVKDVPLEGRYQWVRLKP